MSFADDLKTEVQKVLDDSFDGQLTEANRERIADTLTNWLYNEARKKRLADLPERLEQFRKRIVVLANELALTVEDNELVVKASGDARMTLLMLERGTDWFDPAGDVTVMIVGAILIERS